MLFFTVFSVIEFAPVDLPEVAAPLLVAMFKSIACYFGASSMCGVLINRTVFMNPAVRQGMAVRTWTLWSS